MRRRLAALLAAVTAVGTGCGGSDDDRVDLIDVASAPYSLAVGAGSVWVGNDDGVRRLDGNGKTVEEFGIGPSPSGLAFHDGVLWVVNGSDGNLISIDPRSDEVKRGRRKVGTFEASRRIPVVGGEGALWVAVEDSVVRVDTKTGKPRGEPIQVGGSAQDIVVARGTVWVLIGTGTKRIKKTGQTENPEGSVLPSDEELTSVPGRDGTLVRIDPRTGEVRGKPIALGGDTRGMAFGAGALWITQGGGGVLRVDPETGRRVGAPIRFGESSTEVAVGEGSVWVVDPFQNAVYEVDPGTGKPTGTPVTIPSETEGVSGEAGAVVAGVGAVWVGNETRETLTRIEP